MRPYVYLDTYIVLGNLGLEKWTTAPAFTFDSLTVLSFLTFYPISPFVSFPLMQFASGHWNAYLALHIF
jgi:arginine exporter protein ArgO